MYVVAIAWLYVTLLMAATENSLVAGITTFLGYGVLPLALFLWIMGGPARKRSRAKAEAARPVGGEPPKAEGP